MKLKQNCSAHEMGREPDIVTERHCTPSPRPMYDALLQGSCLSEPRRSNNAPDFSLDPGPSLYLNHFT
eukprot:3043418-Amphidinium_carterae.1